MTAAHSAAAQLAAAQLAATQLAATQSAAAQSSAPWEGANVVDVIIVGGGPIGLAAAINARMHGLSALVIERRHGSLDKACGEGVMPGAVAELAAIGVHPQGQLIAGISYHDATHTAGHTAEHRFAAGTALGVRRTELQRALAVRADELGVSFLRERVVAVHQRTPGAVVAQLADGRKIDGRWMLGCDGLHSTVRELVGLAARSRRGRRVDSRRFGLRQHFLVAPWSDLVEVYWAGTAEVYVTPVSDDVVGVAVLGRRGTSFAATLNSVPALAARLRGAGAASELRGAGPLLQVTRGQRMGRVLLVGDAAGYVDAITGEGLRLGLAQARAAVDCIVAGEPQTYERRWRQITGNFRRLTAGLVAVANSPLRGAVVPLAARLPKLFGRIVESLAR
ncbi:MAG: NAD(P)/FAD-dependent oxidoreductase [Rhodoglobus sp.]